MVSTKFELVLQNSVPQTTGLPLHSASHGASYYSATRRHAWKNCGRKEQLCVLFRWRSKRYTATKEAAALGYLFSQSNTSRRLSPILLLSQSRCWKRDCITAGDGFSAITAYQKSKTSFPVFQNICDHKWIKIFLTPSLGLLQSCLCKQIKSPGLSLRVGIFCHYKI